MNWQYNGVRPWEEIIQWCYKNLQGLWYANRETIYFRDSRDYAWFLLKFNI